MKRYRCARFFIDGIRNIGDQRKIADHVASRYGNIGIEEKLERYLSFRPPPFRIITQYHDLLQEIEDSYVYGLYYPTLTSSCCLGERIFNILIIRLRDYYKTTKHYKHVYQKDSFDDWDKSIEILCDWKVITSADVKTKYKKLAKIRHNVIHFNRLEDIETKALDALTIIYGITTYFFAIGHRKDIYFWCPGEVYVKKEVERNPFVKEMILPHCFLVGYRHRIEPVNNQLVIRDSNSYEEKEISDDEFVKLREAR